MEKTEQPDVFEGDLTDLPILDEAHILDYVCCRYEDNQIYTYSGNILIAVNPWKKLSCYSEQYSKLYLRRALRDNPPHCFAIADAAYRRMIADQADQSILVSGESGAGKTETAKFLLQHIAFCSSYDESGELSGHDTWTGSRHPDALGGGPGGHPPARPAQRLAGPPGRGVTVRRSSDRLFQFTGKSRISSTSRLQSRQVRLCQRVVLAVP